LVKANGSTLHDIQHYYNSLPRRAAMTRYRLSRRIATTTRFSPKAFISQAFTRWRHLSTHPIKQACYSFIDPERMKSWVGLVGWPVADGLPT